MHPKLLADKVRKFFSHEPVRSELSAKYGHHAFKPVFLMVSYMKTTAHFPTLSS